MLQYNTIRRVSALKHVQENYTFETEGVVDDTRYINKLYGLFTFTKSFWKLC
jgi:hypothetical protein